MSDNRKSPLPEQGHKKTEKAETFSVFRIHITLATPSRQSRPHRSRVLCNMVLVELRGIEPLSESSLTGTSPGADDCLHSLAVAGTVTLYGLVAS